MTIRDEDHLEDLLSEPTPGAIETLSALDGDVLVLGAGGRLGPGLCRMARRALESVGSKRKVIALSRFSAPGIEEKLQSWGVETRAADLLAPRAFEFLPDAPLVVHLVGHHGDPGLSWATNAFLPGLVARRYQHSRIVALGSDQSEESGPGRERLFSYFAEINTTPTAILRPSGIAELRSGPLVALARKVWCEETISLSSPEIKPLWQGDASAFVLQALGAASTPATVFNLTGPETLSVRSVAEFFAQALGKSVTFTDTDRSSPLPLPDARTLHGRFGYPRVPAQTLLEWTAAWTREKESNP
jgi:nucleoside-diphosphate-sugar epimerase